MEYKEVCEEVCEYDDKTRIRTHPAFGMLGFSRITGGDNTLFGSSIKHNNRIQLVIQRGEESRSLHSDRYHGLRGKIIEVEMSYSQFAEAITSMNIGDGVPCTIRYTEKEGRLPLIVDNLTKRQQFSDEFKDTIRKSMSQIQAVISEIQETLDAKKSLGVKDRRELVSKLQQAKYNIGCNLDFCSDQFNEQMELTVTEAKGEIEAFCQNKINSIATAALSKHVDSIKDIENPVGIEEQ